jgi:hypothetical protein
MMITIPMINPGVLSVASKAAGPPMIATTQAKTVAKFAALLFLVDGMTLLRLMTFGGVGGV